MKRCGVREAGAALFGRIEDGFDRLESRMDAGFIAVNEQFGRVDARFERVEARMTSEFAAVRRELAQSQQNTADRFAEVHEQFKATNGRIDKLGEALTADLRATNGRIDELGTSLTAEIRAAIRPKRNKRG
jgi:hypothetical protein